MSAKESKCGDKSRTWPKLSTLTLIHFSSRAQITPTKSYYQAKTNGLKSVQKNKFCGYKSWL